MIQEISTLISSWLKKNGVISSEHIQLFEYAVHSLMFGLLPIILSVVLGIVFSMLKEGLLMIFPFMLIRKFSGGYHLKSQTLCIAFSCVSITLMFLLIKAILSSGYFCLLSWIVCIAVFVLFVFSPIDNAARKLSEKEIRCFRRITRFLSLAVLSAYVFLYYTKQNNLSVPIGVGILLPALLQLPCILKSK